ncbi:MAG: glycosyltransferase [Cyanobacteria bacterium J06614_10]
MPYPPVTLVVVPRERFQFTQEALKSLYDNTAYPFQLIYIDNHSPAHIQDYLAQQAKQKGFQLIRSAHYLSPNQARNLALRQVKTPYVCFLDNDVLFSPGWLTALVNCAQETGATVVGSLVCQYKPLHTIIHCVGGDYMNPSDYARFARGERGPNNSLSQPGQWNLEERTYFQNQPIADVKEQLTRRVTGFVEFHAMLVRTSVFNRIGLLDEGFSCTKEYLDFCMSVTKIGGVIYFEPASIVTFLTHPPAPRLLTSDLPYFMLRWSDDWERSSLLHFQKKWNLATNGYFQRRYKKLGQRRRKEMIKPVSEKFSFLGKPFTKWLENQLVKIEKMFNRRVSKQYWEEIAAAKHLEPSLQPSEQDAEAPCDPPCFPDLLDRQAYLSPSQPHPSEQLNDSKEQFETV